MNSPLCPTGYNNCIKKNLCEGFNPNTAFWVWLGFAILFVIIILLSSIYIFYTKMKSKSLKHKGTESEI